MNRLKKNMKRLEEFNMLRVKEFMTKERYEIDEQINCFNEDEHNGVNKVYDVKFNTFLDTYHNVIMSSALLIYDEVPYVPKRKKIKLTGLKTLKEEGKDHDKDN